MMGGFIMMMRFSCPSETKQERNDMNEKKRLNDNFSSVSIQLLRFSQKLYLICKFNCRDYDRNDKFYLPHVHII